MIFKKNLFLSETQVFNKGLKNLDSKSYTLPHFLNHSCDRIEKGPKSFPIYTTILTLKKNLEVY